MFRKGNKLTILPISDCVEGNQAMGLQPAEGLPYFFE